VDRILVVDDDVGLTELLAEYFREEQIELDAVHDGPHGVERVRQGNYDLVILDIMLPKLNGFDALRQIRAYSKVPIIMLTARGGLTDKILGLETGADDYLPKPFHPPELVARVRSILRRTRHQLGLRAEVLTVGDVRLDPARRTVHINDGPISLTSFEFDLLHELLRTAGHPLSREVLSRVVLQREFSPFDRSIDNLVSILRKKLGPDAAGHERIKSIRNVGYVYTDVETCG
jgi:two-component system response regulator CpxR